MVSFGNVVVSQEICDSTSRKEAAACGSRSTDHQYAINDILSNIWCSTNTLVLKHRKPSRYQTGYVKNIIIIEWFARLLPKTTQLAIQYIPRNMHTVFALLCFVVVIYWLIFPYPSGLLHWHCGNLTIAPVPAKQPWWIWINTSCEFIMNDCITTTKQSTTKPCAYFLGYTVHDFVFLLLSLGWLLRITSKSNNICGRMRLTSEIFIPLSSPIVRIFVCTS